MLIIDGHNLIGSGALPNLSLSDPDDEVKLLALLKNYHALHLREPMQVIFDPGPEGGLTGSKNHGGISVRFAPRGSSADSVIVNLLRRHANPRQLTVVTSDHELRQAARSLGAQILSAPEFAARMNRRPLKRQTHNDDEKPKSADVEYWLREFKRKR